MKIYNYKSTAIHGDHARMHGYFTEDPVRACIPLFPFLLEKRKPVCHVLQNHQQNSYISLHTWNSQEDHTWRWGSQHPTTHTLLWEPTWNIFAIDSHGDLSQNWLDTWKNRKYCASVFLKSNARLNACLSKPFGKKRRKTTHKSWKEIWLSPHCLTLPSQLLNFSTAHTGALRWGLCCDVINSSHRCGKALDISTHFDRKSKVGRTEETWVCGNGGWGIHSKSACYASS